MNKIVTSIIVLFFCIANAQSSNIILEHTFNGYYAPHNFPVLSSGDEPIFFPVAYLSPDNNKVTVEIFNEDFTLNERKEIYLPIHKDYKVNNISSSPEWILPNGDRFLIVYYFANDVMNCDSNKLCLSDIISFTGECLYSQSANSALGFWNSLYEINGKCCLIGAEMISTSPVRYKTHIFSLDAISNVSQIEVPATTYPLITFDLNGRILEQPVPGIITITTQSDGKSVKIIN